MYPKKEISPCYCNNIRRVARIVTYEEYDLIPALGDREKMKQVILKAVEMKPYT